MWELDHKESWLLKIWCFWTMVLEKIHGSLLDCKEIKPEEISPEYSLEGQMLKLKLQYFGLLIQITDSLEKTLMLGSLEGKRRRGNDRGWDSWMKSPSRWTWVWANSGSWWQTGERSVLQSMGSQRVGHDWTTEQNWIDAFKTVTLKMKFLQS